jgi:hypothetical protein
MRPPSLESVVFIAQHTVDHSGATLPARDNAESLFGGEGAIRPEEIFDICAWQSLEI